MSIFCSKTFEVFFKSTLISVNAIASQIDSVRAGGWGPFIYLASLAFPTDLGLLWALFPRASDHVAYSSTHTRKSSLLNFIF